MPNHGRAFALALGAALVAAGCLGVDAPGGSDANAPRAAPEALGVAFDAADTVATLTSFVKTYPHRHLDNADHNGARDWLAAEFASLGLEVVRQEFMDPSSAPLAGEAGPPVRLVNVVGIKWGTDRSSWVVVGGHYDTVVSAVEGAYDDGSGTMLTVGLARALGGLPTERTIVFVAFDGEERGLRGSRYFVDSVMPDAYDIEAEPFPHAGRFFAHIDLDMFGINWPAEPPIVLDQNSPGIRAYVERRAAELGVPADRVEYRGISAGRSDYASFEDAGVPVAFFISDFDDVYYREFQLPRTYPFWHQMDTVETMTEMAGGPDMLVAGFQTALDLAGGLLVHLAASPGLVLSIEDAEA